MHIINDVEPGAAVGQGTKVWHYAQIREGAALGKDCVIGRGAYVGPGVRIGDNCKIQNYALVYDPAVIEDGVFIGPAVVLTNDRYPRAVSPDGALRGADDWDPVGVTIHHGASVGARSVCVAPVTIGAWALVAAGSTVIRDVPAFALVAGSPAKQVGWVGKQGVPLEDLDDGLWRCPASGDRYREIEGALVEEDS
jgi:acetyltransferase-like isoleucine patch superfamily enzyme